MVQLSEAAHPISEAQEILRHLVPQGKPFPPLKVPLMADECRWFVAGVKAGLFRFGDCRQDCDRLRKWLVSGPDEFPNSKGKPRHLFSSPHKGQPTFNREYLPHLAAYGRAILERGYGRERASFSQYFAFQRDLITKRKGQTYEVDALFYGPSGQPYLHIEAKADPTHVVRMAAAIGRFQELAEMRNGVAKEVEYVLDLRPSYLWLVGPGTVDPEAYVWHVEVNGLRARFEPVPTLPPPPI